MSRLKRQARRYKYKVQHKYRQDPFAFMVLWALFFSAIFLIFAFRGLIASAFMKRIDIDETVISTDINEETDGNSISEEVDES